MEKKSKHVTGVWRITYLIITDNEGGGYYLVDKNKNNTNFSRN